MGGGEDYALASVCNVSAGVADGISERLYPGWIDPRSTAFFTAGVGAWVGDAAKDPNLRPNRHDLTQLSATPALPLAPWNAWFPPEPKSFPVGV